MSSEISSKDARKSKKSSSSSTKKTGGPELFVLPPHILQKLGINLGSIKDGGPNTVALPDTHDSSIEPKRSRKSNIKNKIPGKKQSSQSSNQSPDDKCSIMETANLMKKSVFLSPTFVTTDSIDREIELSTVSTEDVALCVNEKGNNDVQIGKGMRRAKKVVPVNVTNKKTKVAIPKDCKISGPVQPEKNDCDNRKVSTSEIQNTKVTNPADNTIDSTLAAENIIKETKSQFNTTETCNETLDRNNHHSQIIEATDEHLDEAYLSDCSNSNLEAISAPISPLNLNNAKKVQIIHEEVFDLSTYNNLVMNVFSPDKGSLIPVPINSVVSVQAKLPEAGESKEDPLPVDQSIETDERFIEQICREVKSLDDININMLDVICDDNYVIDESSDTTKMQNNNFDNLILYVANDIPNPNVIGNIQMTPIKETKTLNNEGTLVSIQPISSQEPDVWFKDVEKEISNPNKKRSLKLQADSFKGPSTHSSTTNQDVIVDSKPLGDRNPSTNIITKEEVTCNQETEIHSAIETPSIKKENCTEQIDPSRRKSSTTVKNKDKVVEIASYLSKYVKNRRSSSSPKTLKQYENRNKKMKCQSKIDKSRYVAEKKTEYPSSYDIDLVVNTTVSTIDTQYVEESCKWLNQEFGKLCCSALSPNSHDNVYYWGENSLDNCEYMIVEVDFVEYVTSRINDWTSENIESAREAHSDTIATVSDLDNHTVVIETEPEPTTSASQGEESLVDLALTDNMNQQTCSAMEVAIGPEPKSVDVAESDLDEIPIAELRKQKLISKRQKKRAAASSSTSEALRRSTESKQELHRTIEQTDAPQTPSSPIENSCLKTAQDSKDASHGVGVGRKRRSRRILSSSDDGANGAGEPSYVSDTNTSIQDSRPSRQSARSHSKRLRTTLADYSSSDEVIVPIKKKVCTNKEEPALNLDGSIRKKRGRKRKNAIAEPAPSIVNVSSPPKTCLWERAECSINNDSHKLSGDCNHNQTAVASPDTNCDTTLKLNTSDVNRNTSDIQLNTSDIKLDRNDNCDSGDVECDVCNERLQAEDWIDHIAKKHMYLAWKKGDTPVDINDPAAVQKFLVGISKEIGGFTCYKCGDKKKYPQVYRKHVEQCEKQISEIKIGAKAEYTPEVTNGLYTCTQCGEQVKIENWQEHSLKQHYNLAWPVGGEPINIRNPVEAARYLKIYTQHGNELRCKVCGATRASALGFYAHVLTCGKTEAEVNAVMDHCEVCDKKYLCIYKTQHEAAHRDKLANQMRRAQIEHAKQEQAIIDAQTEHAQTDHAVDDSAPAGRRRKAAEKARNVIMELEEVQSKNIPSSAKSESESDGSDAVVSDESDESDESDVDSNVSREEDDDEARQSHVAIQSQPVVPFKCHNVNEYATRGFKDFCTRHYTKDTVFPEWVSCYTYLSDEPPEELSLLDTSCQLKLFGSKWTTFKKFQGFCAPVPGLYLGAAPSCMSWAPPRDYVGRGDSVLGVACYNGADAPRLLPAETRAEPALLQIWNFGDFQHAPKLSLAIILPAAAWAMSWCPAVGVGGVEGVGGAGGGGQRLGLVAVACGDGGVYIYCVPQTDTEPNTPKFCKLKPVGELRLSASQERKRIHATAIHWSMQNGNSQIMVGYADGLIARFDLESASPLSRLEEDGVSVFLPYHQERAMAGCITGVCHLPGLSEGEGALGASSTTGSMVGAGAARTMVVAPSAHAQFLPGWGAMVVTTDDLSVSELNVWGGGRSLRMQRPLAVCARCACAAAAAGARLRCMPTLPQHAVIKNERQNVLNIEMVPLHPPSKRIKHTGNTEQEMTIEPLTYEAAVAAYGVQVAATKKKQTFTTTERDDRCERFPLADMTALAFCPAARHHTRLAVAAHAGLLIVVDAH